ncbi:MAG: hypothetical protein ACKPKO_03915, partial [Candidatus Fonsibacter sp.]
MLPEVRFIVPVNEVPEYQVQAALRPAGTVRIGVDLCGVLLANVPARMLHNICTPQYVAQGLVAGGAMDWLEECV